MNGCSPVQCAETCTPSACRLKCSIEVVDELLSEQHAVTGKDMDLLLDFRSSLRAREDADATLRLFCQLRRRLEHHHYLSFFRLRRWLENNLACEVRGSGSADAALTSLRLDFYCIEAVRRSCLCAAIQKGNLSQELRFVFLTVYTPTSRVLVN